MSRRKPTNRRRQTESRSQCASLDFRNLVRELHRNEGGTISIATVFCLLMFTMLLVMVVNTATHLDDKIKMQNAADSSAYSGGVVLARGMNSIAFTNHLLADVFAMTAYLREGRDRHGDQIADELLDEWEITGERLSQAEFEKFRNTGIAVLDKIPKERELVIAFAEMTAAASEYALPVFEMILAEEMIPEFQRTLVRTIPELAQRTSAEIAIRNGLRRDDLQNLPNPPRPRDKDLKRGPQTAVLWRTSVMPVGFPDEDDPMLRTLPAIDPAPEGDDFYRVPDVEIYFETAIEQRRDLAAHYLERWTRDRLRVFDNDAEMSQYSNLWRIFTCAQLELLLDVEYPQSNLPMVIRKMESGRDVDEIAGARAPGDELNVHLENNFQFVSVVYRKHLPETGPGLFTNPLDEQSDAQTFAQVSLFVPQPRQYLSRGGGLNRINVGGTFGFTVPIDQEPPPSQAGDPNAHWVRENWPRHWDLLNQNWTVKLVPATAPSVPAILQENAGGELENFRTPDLGNATIRDIKQINTH